MILEKHSELELSIETSGFGHITEIPHNYVYEMSTLHNSQIMKSA